MRKVLSVALALGIVAAACIWVSAVRFKDEVSATDCGTPLSAARHGQSLPVEFARISEHIEYTKVGLSKVDRLSGDLVVVCRGEARTRLAISALVIVGAIAAAVLLNRRPRRGRAPPTALDVA